MEMVTALAYTAEEVNAAFAFRATKPGKQLIIDRRVIAAFTIMARSSVIGKYLLRYGQSVLEYLFLFIMEQIQAVGDKLA
jgi:hypothetical protein